MPHMIALCFVAVIRVQGKECEVEIKNVSGTAGDTLTLPTGLTEFHENNHILWYLSNKPIKETLICLNSGKECMPLPKRFEERLHVDTKTGSLTIQPLSINDTGIYCGEMFDRNNMKICYEFHLTAWKAPVPGHDAAAVPGHDAAAVPGHDTAAVPDAAAVPGRDAAADHRNNHLAVIFLSLAVSTVLFV